MNDAAVRAGDFSALAGAYAKYRPGYAPSIVEQIVAMVKEPIDAVDVGAGTGIWSRQLAKAVRRVIAVEPNAEMRQHGEHDCAGLNIAFHDGSGEQTGLPAASADLLTMASSFHWVDFERGLAEFHRVLKPGGRFLALWNPRVVDANPLFRTIEDQIRVLKPDLKRVSSGNTAFTESLGARLGAHPGFDDVVTLEDTHVEFQSRERYLGLWRSVIRSLFGSG
jgi:SAM-dependent methyltransferase